MDNRLMLIVAAIVLVVVGYALYSGRFPSPTTTTAPPTATPTTPAAPPPKSP